MASTSDSSWESKQDGNGDDCGADVDCTSSHIAIGDPDDPKPQAFAVGMGTTTLQLKLEATGSDFIANDTQGNQVKITDIPADTCETSVWTFCKDSLTWKGVVLIHRTA